MVQGTEGGRPRVLRRNDWLGSQGVLSGFTWVLTSTHGFSWVLMGDSDCAFLGSRGGLSGRHPSSGKATKEAEASNINAASLKTTDFLRPLDVLESFQKTSLRHFTRVYY